MAKKQKEIYVQGTAFTQNELDYINKCALSIPYEIDITRATILIPESHSELYRDNLHVLHLINQFSFSPQITIGAVLRDIKVFNPEMRTSFKPTTDEAPKIILPKRGEIWVHNESKQRYYFEKVDKDSMRVKFLNSLINEKTFKVSDIEFLVLRGDLVKEIK